ncbi:MAG: MaoC/PaaZ C-terminal domain-containing protein [Actinomycetota bacterium]
MPIDPAVVGTEYGPFSRSWESKDALLYAVGVGAGTDELQFTTENSADIHQQVLPTFATVVGGGAGGGVTSLGSFNPAMLVHGEQAIELHAPIPVEGTATTSGRIAHIWDKGSGAVVIAESLTIDEKTGTKLFSSRASIFIRGEGGFGGERGPSGPRNVPPERAPDHVVSYETLPQQALLYRLSGDRNPLHSDPQFAATGGFDRPILHGLCTYGFTGRALLHTLCGSDPARFRSIEGRFAKPVWPGDTLTVTMWVDGNEAIFTTQTQRDEEAIQQGLFTFDG